MYIHSSASYYMPTTSASITYIFMLDNFGRISSHYFALCSLLLIVEYYLPYLRIVEVCVFECLAASPQ